MRLTIAAVGRLKDGAERVLVDRYVARIGNGRATGLGPLVEHEVAESRRPGVAERQAEEAQRLRKASGEAAVLVALDETGRSLTSADFARWIGSRRDAGSRDIAFLIGGADGLDAGLRTSAGLVLSLGPMTLPHGLARTVLAEQLYRATTILSGHPYHRG